MFAKLYCHCHWGRDVGITIFKFDDKVRKRLSLYEKVYYRKNCFWKCI